MKLNVVTEPVNHKRDIDALRVSLQECCPLCTYSMVGNTTRTCPECGSMRPPNLLALPARHPQAITFAHLLALPITLAIWLPFLLVILLIADDASDAVLIPICIAYIAIMVPMFFVVARFVSRWVPIARKFPHVFVASASGYGLCSRNGIGPELLEPWYWSLELRCKARHRTGVVLELGSHFWLEVAFSTEVRLPAARANDLADLIRHWIEFSVPPVEPVLEFLDEEC